MRARRDDGTELNAEFDLTTDGDGFALTLHSAGGKVTGSPLPRNGDYVEALRTLLIRLGRAGAILTGALLDSTRGRNLDPAARHVPLRDRNYPVALAEVTDHETLRLAITSSLGDVARGAGTRKSGNNSKRVRLALTLPVGTDPAVLTSALTEPAPGSSAVGAHITVTAVEEPTDDTAAHENRSTAVSPKVPRQGSGQGRQSDPAVRRAVERHAMTVATAYYESRGYIVTDSSRASGGTNPWDLTCVLGDRELHVEVKGTTGKDMYVNLTRNEVAHASDPDVEAALFLVYEIAVTGDSGAPVASGGMMRSVEPWVPDPARLTPTMFSYRL